LHPCNAFEAGIGCEPDPAWSYTAPHGYLTCLVVVKASTDTWTFTEDGCKGNAENPAGYCVSGLGTAQLTVTRTCGNLPHCHALSHIEPWINASPTAVTLSAVDVTPPERSPLAPAGCWGRPVTATVVALAHWYGRGWRIRISVTVALVWRAGFTPSRRG
jgi:hypothetical protein